MNDTSTLIEPTANYKRFCLPHHKYIGEEIEEKQATSCIDNAVDKTDKNSETTVENNKNNDDGEEEDKKAKMLSLEFGVHRLPETEEEVDRIEEMLANSFNKLSMVEREKVMFDIHGISQAYDETDPPNVDELLEQLEDEIEKIQHKDDYNLAKVSFNKRLNRWKAI